METVLPCGSCWVVVGGLDVAATVLIPVSGGLLGSRFGQMALL